MMARRLFLLAFSAALLTAFGCSNDGGGGTTPPSLACSDGGAAAANNVVLSCGGATGDTTERVAVVIGGPSSGSTTLRGLSFDVPYDATKLQFVPAGSYTSPLFPTALVAVGLFNGQQGRVLVSIQQPGGQAPVSVVAGQHEVIGLSFSRASGTTFAPTTLVFENAEATAASPSVAFSGSLALSYQ